MRASSGWQPDIAHTWTLDSRYFYIMPQPKTFERPEQIRPFTLLKQKLCWAHSTWTTMSDTQYTKEVPFAKGWFCPAPLIGSPWICSLDLDKYLWSCSNCWLLPDLYLYLPSSARWSTNLQYFTNATSYTISALCNSTNSTLIYSPSIHQKQNVFNHQHPHLGRLWYTRH